MLKFFKLIWWFCISCNHKIGMQQTAKKIHLLSVHSIQNALNESYHTVMQERVQVYDMMIIRHTVMPGR
jgi:hypothetical protein